MQTRPVELAGALSRGLAPIYLVSGDEPLLVQECCEEIIAQARADGYDEREIVDVDAGFAWARLREQAGSMSLFSQRRLIDLRVPPKQLDRAASEALRDYLARPLPDTLLLIRSARLEPAQRQSAWFKAIDAAGVIVLVWPVTPAELPRWLEARCRRAGLTLEERALAYLASRVEGNLLAAVQEIEKLRMLAPSGPVTLEAVRSAVADASHYESFDAVDAALAGQSRRLRHVLKVLRQEGAAPLALLGAVVNELRRLQSGKPGRMPRERARHFEQARARLGRRELEELVMLGAVVDEQVKGLRGGDPWQTLEAMLLLLAGAHGVRAVTRHADGLRRA